MRIPLVNDEPSVREAMTAFLVHVGKFDVETAADGDEAIRMCRVKGHFDFVLTDFRHPGPRGTELVRRIRENSPTQRIAFVTGLTGDEMQRLRSELAELSVMLWEAPVQPFELVNSINSLLGE